MLIGTYRLSLNLSCENELRSICSSVRRVTDSEALSMSRHLALNDGLFLGSSSAVNLVACVKLAQKWMRDGKAAEGGRRLRIVTILCDSGSRHTSKFWYVALSCTHMLYSNEALTCEGDGDIGTMNIYLETRSHSLQT